MPEFVGILEDDARHIAAMRACLPAVLPGIEPVFFEDAALMIAWLDGHLADVALLSLDHDLPLRSAAGEPIDRGTGRQVADWLAARPPTCPVIVHSSNAYYAPGMCFALADAGWPCRRVYPCDDEAWIAGAWAEQIRRLAREGWIGQRQ